MAASHSFFGGKTAGHGKRGWVARTSPIGAKGPSCAQTVLAAFGGCGTAPGGSFRSPRGYGDGLCCWTQADSIRRGNGALFCSPASEIPSRRPEARCTDASTVIRNTQSGNPLEIKLRRAESFFRLGDYLGASGLGDSDDVVQGALGNV